MKNLFFLILILAGFSAHAATTKVYDCVIQLHSGQDTATQVIDKFTVSDQAYVSDKIVNPHDNSFYTFAIQLNNPDEVEGFIFKGAIIAGALPMNYARGSIASVLTVRTHDSANDSLIEAQCTPE